MAIGSRPPARLSFQSGTPRWGAPSLITNRFGQIDVETIYEAPLMLEVTMAELAAQRAMPEEVAASESSQSVVADCAGKT